MHVIAKPALVAFWQIHPDAESSLTALYRIVTASAFVDFNSQRAVFASADYVAGLTVFNIGGNKYRLITSIHYNRQKIYVRAVLKHAEYDHGEWKKRTKG